MKAELFSPLHLSWSEALLRLAAGVLLPLQIELDCLILRKPIEFRPSVIVSLIACGLSLAIMELAHEATNSQVDVNPARVFSGVIVGIGFLGAGAMFRRDHVRGAGLASSIWTSGVIGIVCGIGLLRFVGILATIVLVLLVARAPITSKHDADWQA